MANTRTIDIDFEVHQAIELERTSFDEAPNDALRRLLKLPPRKDVPSRREATSRSSGRAWSGKGVTLPHGTKTQMEYNGSVYSGQIEDGKWVIENETCNSPSRAAHIVAKTRDGTSPSLNGWIYWQVKRPGDGHWMLLDSLRQK